MNHLAHALIAERTGTSIVGNLMGDYVRGSLDRPGGLGALGGPDAPVVRMPEAVVEGIRLHRRVDAWTDEHPLFRQSRERIRPAFRRWAGILVDLWWDHVLARRWDDLGVADEPLPEFAARVYDELRRARGRLPERMLPFVDYLVSTDLLVAYAEPDGIRRALTGLSRRVRRENPLAAAAADLPGLYPGLEADFVGFRAGLFEWLGTYAPGGRP